MRVCLLGHSSFDITHNEERDHGLGNSKLHASQMTTPTEGTRDTSRFAQISPNSPETATANLLQLQRLAQSPDINTDLRQDRNPRRELVGHATTAAQKRDLASS